MEDETVVPPELTFLFAAADKIEKLETSDEAGLARVTSLLETSIQLAEAAAAVNLELDQADPLPPAWLVEAVGWNKLGEVLCDTGSLGKAATCFRTAVTRWPAYPEPQLSLAQLDREAGRFTSALRWFAQVRAHPQPSHSMSVGAIDEASEWCWYAEWVVEPWARCRSVAAYHEAHLLSRLGRHAEAVELLQSFGVRWRIAPDVWYLSHAPRTASDRRCRQAPGLGGPRFFRDAVPPELGTALRRGFAPGAAYWSETGYDSREYFSWWYDLAVPPQTAVDHLIHHLLPLVGLEDVVGAEWWVHSRPQIADFGHQLHFDMEERTLERTGRVLNPALSSVVYLSGNGRTTDGAGATLVLDQRIDAVDFADQGWLVRPAENSFMTFPGDLLHGVIPGAPPPSHRSHKSATSPRRLTLMIGWWTASQCAELGPTSRRSHGPGPACTAPRPSSRITWPSILAVPEELEKSLLEARETTADGVDVNLVSPIWEELPSCDAEPEIEIPRSIDQRFFVKTIRDFRDAVFAEHYPDAL